MRVTMLSAALFAALVSMTAPASAKLELWQGDVSILLASPQCTSGDGERRMISVGTVLRSLFRPSNVGDNGTDTRISFNHDGQSNFAMIIAGNPVTSGNYTSFGVTHSGVLVANRGSTFRNFRSTPATVGISTEYIEYYGTVVDFMFIPGCTVTFSAGYQPRPSAD